ncbi:UDP-N-acetylmuramate dehydrogenase [Brevibacterium otitidis]|uniref:UDP-N-acetylenolpyruvoylglucosamine reductase n=1 Tax=Brevibacterium otitidis TaxID=53364 RepID=A0ABV5WYE1_9MICO|nr:UDP-N-acetylmuramate dehydrogenase [Brevibacterium otitidis]
MSDGAAEVRPSMLADHTTMRVGGPAADVTAASTREQLLDFLTAHPLTRTAASTAAEAGQPAERGQPAEAGGARGLRPDVLFIAGGSNLVISDEGFAGPVCLIRTRGREYTELDGGRVRLRVAAGENWDDCVAETVARGLSGLEALSGIPGSAGATPVQNVGAYGAEVADTLESVTVCDRLSGDIITLPRAELEFGYRTSRLKRSTAEFGTVRFVVLDVSFVLTASAESAPIRYQQLAGTLGVELDARVPLAAVREAVLAVRASKGMVLDPADHDTWSAGSFFTNPIVPVDTALPEGAPEYPVIDPLTGMRDEKRKKTSAAWLIDTAGFHKGFGIGEQRARLSTKHTLALTNRGQARTADVLELAAHIRDGVAARTGIRLEPEPNLIGCRF